MTAERDELKKDAERLDWLMRKISGSEFRRIGVMYGENCNRDSIDSALSQAPGEKT
jgi:hypothetical protein